eukprot:EG_transcript_63795
MKRPKPSDSPPTVEAEFLLSSDEPDEDDSPFECTVCKKRSESWVSCLTHMQRRQHQPPGEVPVQSASLFEPFASCDRRKRRAAPAAKPPEDVSTRLTPRPSPILDSNP